jgi:hypothetical protein
VEINMDNAMNSTVMPIPVAVPHLVPPARADIERVRALPAFHPLPHHQAVPRGLVAVAMGGDYPLNYALVDRKRLDFEDGAIMLLRPSDPDMRPRACFVKVSWSKGWNTWVIGAGLTAPGRMSLVNNVSADYLRKRIIGRAVGVLADSSGQPMKELWPAYDGDEPLPDLLDADDFPALYSSKVDGDCLDPMIRDGSCVSFQRDASIKPDTPVVMWRKPRLTTKPGNRQGLLKLFVSGLTEKQRQALPLPDNMMIPPIMLVRTLKPARTWVVPLDQLIAVHKCTGPHAGPGRDVTHAELASIAAAEREGRPLNKPTADDDAAALRDAVGTLAPADLHLLRIEADRLEAERMKARPAKRAGRRS